MWRWRWFVSIARWAADGKSAMIRRSTKRRRRPRRRHKEQPARDRRLWAQRPDHKFAPEVLMRFGIQLRITCLVLLAAMGCEKEQTRTAPPPPKVSVAHPVVHEMIDFDNYNGWLDASATVEVRARVRGHIQKVHFTD